MTSPLYLGEMIFEGKSFTRVEPIAVARDGAWHIGEDWPKLLPPEGKAFAPRQPPFHRGEVFAFDTVPNTRVERDGDLQLVWETSQVQEVFDFRDREPEEARRLIVETGVEVLAPGTRQVIVALPGSQCVLIRMERLADELLYRAHFGGLATLPVYRLDERVFAGDRISGRILSVPDATILGQVDTINWYPDAEFLEFALKRLRKVAAAGEPPLPLSRISSLTTYLVRAGLTPTLGSDLEPIRSRLPMLASSLDGAIAAVDDIVEIISSFRPVADRLEAEMAGRRDALESELRTELEARLRTEAAALEQEVEIRRARFDAEVAELQALGQLATTEAETLRTARDELRAALQDEFLTVNGELSGLGDGEPRALLARIVQRLREKGVDVEPAPFTTPPWARVRANSHHYPGGWDDAAVALEAAAKRFGLSLTDLIVADVAARSGALVLLPEMDAFDFVRCYASVVASGEVVRQSLDPSVLSLDDLWSRPGTGTPTAFASAWAAAKTDARKYRVVVLDGIHRTAMDLWTPPLVGVLRGADRPANLLVFGTLGERLVDPARAWRDLTMNAVPLRPTPASGVSAEILSVAVGGAAPLACLDASAAKAPSRADVLAFVDEYGADLSSPTLQKVMNMLRAAAALRPAVAPAELAMAFSPTRSKDNRYGAPLAAGAAWLEAIIETWE